MRAAAIVDRPGRVGDAAGHGSLRVLPRSQRGSLHPERRHDLSGLRRAVQGAGDAVAADAQIAADPIAASLTFASPKTLFLVGLGLMAGSVALGLLEVFVVGRVHVMLLGVLFVSGAAGLWRSL